MFDWIKKLFGPSAPVTIRPAATAKFTSNNNLIRGSLPTQSTAPNVSAPVARRYIAPQQNFVPDENIVKSVRSRPEVYNHIKKTFGEEYKRALAVSLAENQRFDPKLKQFGGGPAEGLWQFEPNTWKDMGGGNPNLRTDPITSTNMAKKLRDTRGWGQWQVNNTSYPGETRKKYEKFLPYADYIDSLNNS